MNVSVEENETRLRLFHVWECNSTGISRDMMALQSEYVIKGHHLPWVYLGKH